MRWWSLAAGHWIDDKLEKLKVKIRFKPFI
jgi:hypothetical protein